jgi:hypothetical protein
VNGLSAAPGASIVTGAIIETTADQTAEINLGSFGPLDLAPNTQLRLDYDQNGNTKVTLIRGCIILRSKKKAEGEVLTEQGTVAKNDKEKGGVADVCYINGQTTVNQNAAANAISGIQTTATTGTGSGTGLSNAALAAIVLGGLGAIVAVVLATTGDDTSDRPNPSVSLPG